MSTSSPSAVSFNTNDTRGGGTVFNVNGNNYIGNFVNSESWTVELRSDFVVADAAYNGKFSRVPCLKGTREEITSKIINWKNRLGGQPICWLKAPAGFGKSAVAHTIAELCTDDETLGASFFFIRDIGRRSEFNHFITTIAFQLTQSIPAIKKYISDVLRADPYLPDKMFKYQFEQLIYRPVLAAAKDIRSPMVIVVDGLDECNDEMHMQDFIDIVADAFAAHRLPLRFLPLRFLFSSRADPHISQRFASAEARAQTFVLDLAEYDAHDDILRFLVSRFHDAQILRPTSGTPQLWPSVDEIHAVVTKSQGQFLYASTLADYVTDGSAAPQQKLTKALKSHDGMDPLYRQIIQAPSRIEHFTEVIAAFILSPEPLSINILAELLELEVCAVAHALRAISSILHVPADDKTPIVPYHATLRDFLVDKHRSGRFYVDPPSTHMSVALRYLKLMNTTCQEDVLPTSDAHSSACRNWLHHLHSAIDQGPKDVIDGRIIAVLDKFYTSHACVVWINHVIYTSIDRSVMAGAVTTNLERLYSPRSRLENLLKSISAQREKVSVDSTQYII